MSDIIKKIDERKTQKKNNKQTKTEKKQTKVKRYKWDGIYS